MNNFSEFSLSPILKTNLAAGGFVSATPVQAQTIPAALGGSDVVATAQTGTGKTLAFVVPLIESLIASPARGVGAVILTPTRELAIQIHETFTTLAKGTGIGATVVVGGLNEGAQLRDIHRGARVLIATPGRLFDFLSRKLVKLSSVNVLILDEADRMFDMGFLPVIEKILAVVPSSRQTLFFSATIEKSVAPLIDKHLKDPIRVAIGAVTKPSDGVDLHVYEVEQDKKLGLLRSMLDRQEGSFLVFARTKRGADRLAARLSRSGVKAIGIHGDRTQNQRNQALRGFREGYYRVLVATDVAARGIHVDAIAHVVNFDVPQAPEDFIHRVGRTGRAGKRGIATTFVARQERGELRNIERTLKVQLSRQLVPANLAADPTELPPDRLSLGSGRHTPLSSLKADQSVVARGRAVRRAPRPATQGFNGMGTARKRDAGRRGARATKAK
jgi:ATP-dependent RNA helicase RhlE